jgi:hypothetical protein
MICEEDDESFVDILEDHNPLSQWLLVNGGSGVKTDLTSGNMSLEEWLDEASSEREPSIVVISEADSNAEFS